MENENRKVLEGMLAPDGSPERLGKPLGRIGSALLADVHPERFEPRFYRVDG